MIRVRHIKCIWVTEDMGSFCKRETVLLDVGPILVFIPFELQGYTGSQIQWRVNSESFLLNLKFRPSAFRVTYVFKRSCAPFVARNLVFERAYSRAL